MYLDLPWEPLYPSQRSGEISVERAFWRGQERRFAVQWHEDRAYFGLLSGARVVWATLDACEESEVVACFEEAVQNGRYGVCFGQHCKVYRCNFEMCLQFIFAPDGTGLLREWSSRAWLAFAPEETRSWALFPDVVLPNEGGQGAASPECRAAIHCIENELLLRPISNEELERLSFRSGSNQAEFEQVARWLWDTALISPFQPTGFTAIALHTSAPHLRTTINFYGSRWSGSVGLMNWLHSHFATQGFEWRDTHWGKRRFRGLRRREPQLRAWCNPFSVRWDVLFSNADSPTAHQQLEARLHLRDWLRDKATPEQIETWLAPSSQT